MAILDASRPETPFSSSRRAASHTRRWLRQLVSAKVPRSRPRGLVRPRHPQAAAVETAESGATEHELMAQFAWASPKQAARYTRSASRKKLARRPAKSAARKRRSGLIIPNLSHGYSKRAKSNLVSMSWGSGGAQGRNRTSDTRIFNPLLYQLSYLGPRSVSRQVRVASKCRSYRGWNRTCPVPSPKFCTSASGAARTPLREVRAPSLRPATP